MTEHTPMIKQYLEIKQEFPDMLVFYRMGDFYELFFDDAILASKLLGITLTSRGKSADTPIKMAGVPFHAVSQYLTKLVKLNKSIVIVDQVGEVTGKGPVLREVTKIITPGTLTDSNLLDDKTDSVLVSIWQDKDNAAIASLSLSSSKFGVTQIKKVDLINELERINPSEIITSDMLVNYIKQIRPQTPIKALADWNFDLKKCSAILTEHFATTHLDGFGISSHPLTIISAGILIEYAKNTQRDTLKHINGISFENSSSFLTIDAITRRNLEINTTIHGESSPTIFSCLDECNTSMGSRLLRVWLNNPLRNHNEINIRLNALALLSKELQNLEIFNQLLKQLADIERITSRIALYSAKPRDLSALRDSCLLLPKFSLLNDYSNDILINEINNNLIAPEINEITQLLELAILPEPNTFVRDGGVINCGYNKELDLLRNIHNNCEEFLNNLTQREQQNTGINNLKIEFNKVHGFYIEVSNSNLNKVPSNYRRTQTLKNAERFTMETLKEFEEKFLSAKEQAINLEKELFDGLLNKLNKHLGILFSLATNLATLDVLVTFATLTNKYNYNRPIFNNDDQLIIKSGRHLIVERQVNEFIANDVNFDSNTKFFLITGPNMGGKSTFMRQIAIITLLAHCGLFVPATNATFGNIDRIFTRIGASDDLSQGKSTFMVEMSETANILNNATANSLVLMDEIGRGTSTFDGLALAHAIARHIIMKLNCYTLFATHYFELTELNQYHKNVKNLHLSAVEHQDTIVFLHHVLEGAAAKSYGIQVASLAGIPKSVVNLALKYLTSLEKSKEVPIDLFSSLSNDTDNSDNSPSVSLAEHKVLDIIRSSNPNDFNPRQALDLLYELKTQLDN